MQSVVILHWCVATAVVPQQSVVSDNRADWQFVALLNQTVSVKVPSSFHQNFPSSSYRPVETEAAGDGATCSQCAEREKK